MPELKTNWYTFIVHNFHIVSINEYNTKHNKHFPLVSGGMLLTAELQTTNKS